MQIAELDDPARLDDLQDLYLAMHQHHRETGPAALLVADGAASWARRRAVYAAWLAAGEALILVARDEGGPQAYAAVHLLEGPDDTFAVGDRYAELYSLSVLPGARSAGLGTELLDEVDRRLDRLGVADLLVSVMAGNDAARRFYERRGLQPVEVVLARIRPPC
jgi:ribosomal protein S18 acetylase RimI-like enzyme